ncbi:iron-sulfur cluster assembly scaffold protein [Patescibacteria group bacterium]|nr:iron-sulfur cluster assembly scaffold protein [Patescibacteria group bacterium]
MSIFNIFKKSTNDEKADDSPKTEEQPQANVDLQDAGGQEWVYSDEVRQHFFEPQNFASKAPEGYDGLGLVGSPACGDMMKVWIKVDKETEKITDLKWQTFGCASAIASTSALSVMATENGGMKIDDALKITPTDIINRLSGLPDRKIHCSVLGDKALEAAINDYFKKTNQENRIKDKSIRVIDKKLNITEKDIEQAVKDGAKTLAEVQAKTKVGTGDPSCLPEVEELVRYYIEKHDSEK